MTRNALAAVAAAFAAAIVAPSVQAEKILFNSFAPPKFIINNGIIDVWAKNVEKATGGRVKVEFPAQSLAPPQQQWEMVTQGVADGAYIFNAFAQKRLLLPQIAHLPFLTPSGTAQALALWHLHKEMFEKANEHEGVVFIGYIGSPATQWFSLDKPFLNIDDLKNVKVLSLPGDQARSLAALGAVVVPGPAVRSYETVSKGIVQGYGGQNCDASYVFNNTQFAKHYTVVPGGMGSAAFSVFLNEKKWKSLPKQDQDAILKVSGEEIAKLMPVWDAKEKASCDRMRAEGKVQMHEASPQLVADLRKAWAFLEDEWIEKAKTRGVDGKAALARFKELAAKFAK